MAGDLSVQENGAVETNPARGFRFRSPGEVEQNFALAVADDVFVIALGLFDQDRNPELNLAGKLGDCLIG